MANTLPFRWKKRSIRPTKPIAGAMLVATAALPLLAAPGPAGVTLEQIISREDPAGNTGLAWGLDSMRENWLVR